jgi:hypothetical protein
MPTAQWLTPMLDLYCIVRNKHDPFVGYVYCGQDYTCRKVCSGRYSAVKEYFKTLEVAQLDTLAGRNPFVTGAHANTMRASSRFNGSGT